MATKRDRERSIQAWFDPEDAYDNRALVTLDHFANQHNMKIKDVLIWALEVLRTAEWRNDYIPGDARIAEIQQQLSAITHILQDGNFATPGERANVERHAETLRRELNDIESSVAGHYQPLDLDGD